MSKSKEGVVLRFDHANPNTLRNLAGRFVLQREPTAQEKDRLQRQASPDWRVQKRANREQTYIVFENLGDHEKFDTGDRRATIQWLDSNKYKARVTLYPIPPSPRR
jgi:hypothetical protein